MTISKISQGLLRENDISAKEIDKEEYDWIKRKCKYNAGKDRCEQCKKFGYLYIEECMGGY